MSAEDFEALEKDFQDASRKTAKALFGVYKDVGNEFRDDWRKNAKATSGKHGRHYPKSITASARIGLRIDIEVGPDPSRPQGKMGRGFEFGSVKQPPHLDGFRAIPAAEKALLAKSDAAIQGILP